MVVAWQLIMRFYLQAACDDDVLDAGSGPQEGPGNGSHPAGSSPGRLPMKPERVFGCLPVHNDHLSDI